MSTFGSIALGFGAGIGASIVAWWLILLAFTPRLRLSRLNQLELSKNETPCGYRYRVKIQNRLKWYAVSGITLHARLVVKGLDAKRPTVWSSLHIPVSGSSSFPLLDGRKRRERIGDSQRVYTLHIHELDVSAEPDF